MITTTERARIFISCGQNDKKGEVEVVKKVADELSSCGFDPYIAVEESTIRGLTENLFPKIRDYEYFLFIDFARERLGDAKEPCRGSLFAQQELAIAAYLQKDKVLAFQENGVKERDGMIGAWQLNVIHFSDRDSLQKIVCDEVSHQWKSNWQNSLTLCPSGKPRSQLRPPNDKARFFGIRVHNCHLYKDSLNTYAYLDKVVEVSSGKPIQFDAVELRWGGYIFPNARIQAGQSRDLNAFCILESAPNKPCFIALTDAPNYYTPDITAPGEWILTYTVRGDGVPGTTRNFCLKMDATKNGIRFEPC
ncbi:MAG TPA: hypothetical protein VK572_17080 [Burkholderiales bacterium]|nr:hypothetical protein [Burkholderiales bacterium]